MRQKNGLDYLGKSFIFNSFSSPECKKGLQKTSAAGTKGVLLPKPRTKNGSYTGARWYKLRDGQAYPYRIGKPVKFLFLCGQEITFQLFQAFIGNQDADVVFILPDQVVSVAVLVLVRFPLVEHTQQVI